PQRSHRALSRLRGYRDDPSNQPGQDGDKTRVGVRHLDAAQLETELARLLDGLVIQVPADLEVVGDEPDRADEHLPCPPRAQVLELVEDVRAEPGLACRRLALKGECPLGELGALR